MESVVRYILQTYFKDFVASHGDVGLSTMDGVTLQDLQLKHDIFGDWNTESGLKLTGGNIGSLRFTATEYGKMQVVASNVIFDFCVEPMKMIGNALKTGQDATRPGFARPVQNDNFSHWDALMGRCGSARHDQERTRPLYCGLHHKPERRRRGAPRTIECKSCSMKLETNYVPCALCPTCSRFKRRCLLCGDLDIMETKDDLVDYPTISVDSDLTPKKKGDDMFSMFSGFQCIGSEGAKARRPCRREAPALLADQPVLTNLLTDQPRRQAAAKQVNPVLGKFMQMEVAGQPPYDDREPDWITGDAETYSGALNPKAWNSAFQFSTVPPRTLTGDDLDDSIAGTLDEWIESNRDWAIRLSAGQSENCVPSNIPGTEHLESLYLPPPRTESEFDNEDGKFGCKEIAKNTTSSLKLEGGSDESRGSSKVVL